MRPSLAGLGYDDCHNRDASCPGGRECAHRMCHNLAPLEGVSAEENRRRRWEWARRRERAQANGVQVVE